MNIIYKPTGNEIIMSGLDDVEKLKSIQGVTGIWIEEATELDEKDFIQLDLRLRGETANYKQIIMSFNPVYVGHWLNKYTFEDAYKLKTTYRDNLFIDDEYRKVIENLKNEDENMYRVYGLGEWGLLNMSERVYYEFNRERNLFSYDWNFKQGDELILGFDFNVNPMCAVLIAVREREYYQVKEWRVNHSHTAEICEIIVSDLRDMDFDKTRSIIITGDSSGRAKNTKGFMSDYEIIEKAFTDGLVNFYMSIPSANPSIRDRINYTNQLFKLNKFKIHYTCEHSITDRELVTWKKAAQGFALDKSNQDLTHLADAADYVLYNTKNTWGVETAAQKLSQIRMGVNRRA